MWDNLFDGWQIDNAPIIESNGPFRAVVVASCRQGFAGSGRSGFECSLEEIDRSKPAHIWSAASSEDENSASVLIAAVASIALFVPEGSNVTVITDEEFLAATLQKIERKDYNHGSTKSFKVWVRKLSKLMQEKKLIIKAQHQRANSPIFRASKLRTLSKTRQAGFGEVEGGWVAPTKARSWRR